MMKPRNEIERRKKEWYSWVKSNERNSLYEVALARVMQTCNSRFHKFSCVEYLCFRLVKYNRLCSLVGRVPAYRSRDSGFDSLRYQIF
jgi:hypothetical protein